MRTHIITVLSMQNDKGMAVMCRIGKLGCMNSSLKESFYNSLAFKQMIFRVWNDERVFPYIMVRKCEDDLDGFGRY